MGQTRDSRHEADHVLPLLGTRILDFTTLFPGPLATQLLLYLGADVVKVEPPGGDPLRLIPAEFDAVNRGKRSILLNLKDDQDRTIAQKLIVRSDVVVENYRVGVAARLGVDYEQASTWNPSVVYCSISSFGQNGPMASSVGHDINFLAFSGALAKADTLAHGPLFTADLAAAHHAVIAVLSAVLWRERTGRGAWIDLAMADAAMNGMVLELARMEDPGAAPWEQEDVPHYGVFETADGKRLAIGVDTEDHLWERLRGLLRLELGPGLETIQNRVENNSQIREAIARAVKTWDSDELTTLLVENGVPATQVATVQQTARSQYAASRALVSWSSRGPEVALPFLFSGAKRRWGGPPPELDQHRDVILAECETD